MFRLFITIVFISNLLFADLDYAPIPIQKIDNMKKYNLGKKLFCDPNLSSDGTISCATCHVLQNTGVDNLRVSFGVEEKKGITNTPTIFNTKFNIAQDWIGESKTIKQRSKMAFLNPIEMNGSFVKTVKYINSNKELKNYFMQVYQTINEDTILDSITYFVSNLVTPNSKFDKYIQGDLEIYSKKEKEGYNLFKGYGCVSCHNGINVGGNMYQKFGVFEEKNIHRDKNLGRYKVTKKEYDRYVFKASSLRNVSKTYPYLHDGSIEDLDIVIKKMGIHQLGIDIPKEDILKIKLFLKTLDGEIPSEL